MGGGLMQLVAYGAQDIYLTGNPQITFFKVVYRRHTNFSIESIEQTINGNVGAGSRVTSTISRNGDLVYRLFYELTGAAAGPEDSFLANAGANVFDNVEIEIGGQRIDRQSGHWMHVWTSLTQENSARICATAEGKAGTLFQELAGMAGCVATSVAAVTGLRVPLQFWFCRNPGLALPLIALQYHEVKVVTTFSSVFSGSPGASLWADYIYLDTDERRRFAQVSHEYLIEQVQYQASSGETNSTELNFNHPVKELIWTKPWNNGLMVEKSGTEETETALEGTYHIKLNGHDRFAPRGTQYFTKQQVWMHHTGPGGLNVASGTLPSTPGKGADTIAVYSFALKPEEHQPSGTCNFSRIDNAQLHSTKKENRDVFAVNYNVLRIMSGMGGLAYSN